MNRKNSPVLSIVIPAFNEDEKITQVLDALSQALINKNLDVQVIVVDDGSTDSTKSLAESHRVVDQVISYPQNQGRAYAVQQGIYSSTGDQVAVLDADFEYMPEDLFFMLISANNSQVVIYGSRYLSKENRRPGIWGALGRLRNQSVGPWVANLGIKIWVWLLFQHWYSEHFSGIRIYPGKFIRSITWKSSGFEGDHEIAAAAHVLKIPTVEFPISYSPRSADEGKKIRARDGFVALWVFIDWRVRGKRKIMNQARGTE
jgi:dolichol-phosphate mannosyltransferase